TADMYSLGGSETVTGKLLREMAKMEEIVLATKVHFPMSDGPNMGGLSRKHIVQGCEASLARLGVQTIDLYQIHRFRSPVPIDETLAALDHLVRQGKVRQIGAPPAEVALAWLLSKPGVSAPIVGASKLEHLETAVRSLDVKLSQQQIAELEAPYEPRPVRGHQ